MYRGGSFSHQISRATPLLDPAQQRANARKVIWRMVGMLKPYRRSFALGVFLMSITTGLMLLPPLVWRFIVDVVMVKRQVEWLLPAILFMLVMSLLGQWIATWRMMLLGRIGQRFLYDLRNQVYSKLQRQSLSYFHDRRTGDLVSRVISDVDVLQEVFVQGTDHMLSTALSFIGVVAIVVAINWQVGLCVTMPISIVAVMLYFYNKRIRQIYRTIRDRLGEVSAKLQENLSGIHVIKAFAKEGAEADRFHNVTQSFYDENMRAVRTRAYFLPATMFVGALSNIVMIALGAWLYLRSLMSMGDLIAYRGYWWQLFGPLQTLSAINDTIQRGIAAGTRVFEVLDEPEEIKDAPDAFELAGVRGAVQFKSVSFAYAGANGDCALRDVNLSVQTGQTLALVGPSGSGKSTLLSLIPRFYDPQEGVITLDGHDLRALTQRSLREHMAMVLQDTFLFNDTVLFNIKYARPDAASEEVVAAARAANAHDFITELPQGYETEVGERGVKLSGGQKQRISIARAFLANPQILILDEATSAVEPESEAIIQDALERLMRGRTTFIVSHRLSMVRGADTIAVVDGGRIIELGNHAELMQRNGLYAEMYRMQMGEIEPLRGAASPPFDGDEKKKVERASAMRVK